MMCFFLPPAPRSLLPLSALLLCLTAGSCTLFHPLKANTALKTPIDPDRPILLKETGCLRDGLPWESGLPLRAMAETAGTQLGLFAGAETEKPPYRLTLQIHLYRSLRKGLPGTDTLCLATLSGPASGDSADWTAQSAVQGRDNQYPPRAKHLFELIKTGLREIAELQERSGRHPQPPRAGDPP